MDTRWTILEALHVDPNDNLTRLVLADLLEEQGRPEQAELLRLHVQLLERGKIDPSQIEFIRLNQLLQSGVRPVVPERTNSLGMRFALIPAGSFVMGSPEDEESRFSDESPEHRVTLTWSYYLGVFPVTQQEYQFVTGENPSFFSDRGEGGRRVEGFDPDRHPVEMINWDLATRFCDALSQLPEERAGGRRYRLPTEAEWEYACRAGLSGAGPFHQGTILTSHHANFDGRDPFGTSGSGPFLGRTCPVDAFAPNAFGLYDLHGNVSEWCSDWFDEHYYAESPEYDPTGPATGIDRVLRGGSWIDPGRYCRAALRYNRRPEEGRRDFGFRLVMEYVD